MRALIAALLLAMVGPSLAAEIVVTDGDTFQLDRTIYRLDGIDAPEIDQTCLDHIARFKRPKDYRFVDALPVNNYGKVVKRELRDRLRAETADVRRGPGGGGQRGVGAGDGADLSVVVTPASSPASLKSSSMLAESWYMSGVLVG